MLCLLFLGIWTRSVAKKALANRAIGRASARMMLLSSSAAAETAAPSVKDLLIDLTFVDPSGARRKVKGLIGTLYVHDNESLRIMFDSSPHPTYAHAIAKFSGKTLHEVCELHDIDIGPSSKGAAPEIARTEKWTESTFGEGVTSGFDHVVLVGKGAETAARKTPIEQQMLEDYWDFDEIFEGSRLASAITLTKEMDGMTVYVPDCIVDDCP